MQKLSFVGCKMIQSYDHVLDIFNIKTNLFVLSGHALVQYGMQESSTSSSSSPRGQPRSRDREDQYGRRDWSQGQQQQQQSEYDVVHHLFNG